MQWFDVDKAGLAKLLERKGKQFVLTELLSNAWDEPIKRVDVTMDRISGTRYIQLKVVDDSPNGFQNLTHAFTLFADSAKKGKSDQRGRFNLGEKLVLALCEEAQIISTKGGIAFDADGRRSIRTKTERGSVFTGRMRMTTEELQACAATAAMLLPPAHIETYFNGQRIASRTPVTSFKAPLQTEISDDHGNLRRTIRQGYVEVVEALPGETPMLYEMGIPVVETGDRWHLNVTMKVPLTFDRDNVPQAYLAKIRALTLQHTADLLSTEDANAPWVREAMQKHGPDMDQETIATVTALRFGSKAVAFDPSDPEANKLAVSKGYTVVHGGQMSSKEWEAVRSAGALKPAGQVTPSPKPYSAGGDPLKLIHASDWSQGMKAVAAYVQNIAPHLVGGKVQLQISNDPQWPFLATYGAGSGLVLNAGRLGRRWFDGPLQRINELLLHEFAHHFSLDHLSSEYHDALSRLGSKLVELALQQPGLFQLQQIQQAEAA